MGDRIKRLIEDMQEQWRSLDQRTVSFNEELAVSYAISQRIRKRIEGRARLWARRLREDALQ